MKLLLDTCAFLWVDQGDQSRFPREAAAALSDPDQLLLLSVISVWEISVKSGLGKLALKNPLESLNSIYVEPGRLKIVPFSVDDAIAIGQLPLLHRDPFDRMIAVQCLRENLTLLSPDKIFDEYGVHRVWN
ncbi:type II toxin-antitoxin system VapC family toxin [soil metagenome]